MDDLRDLHEYRAEVTRLLKERDALRAANERGKEIARHPRTSQGRVKDYVDAADVLAALDTPTPTEETPKGWQCRRCGSPKWVAASLTGPVSTGGRAIRQCVPCGYYHNDPATTEET